MMYLYFLRSLNSWKSSVTWSLTETPEDYTEKTFNEPHLVRHSGFRIRNPTIFANSTTDENKQREKKKDFWNEMSR